MAVPSPPVVMKNQTFFEHQESARKRTLLLLFYFLLSILCIILTIYTAVCYLLFNTEEMRKHNFNNYHGTLLEYLWDPELFIGVSVMVLVVVTLGSLYKIVTLASGGKAVAELLGAKPIWGNTNDIREKRILNVVEEMAIASGICTPPVYVMSGELGINAFAAGFSPKDAVIGVSEGCLQYLTRDELQGVVAHEFSHILHGDMRLNIRLIGLLNGILVIALLGYWLMRGSWSRSSQRSRNGGNAQLLLFGLALTVVGGIGVFFGKLIKAAVSRQREFLADASAVQYTRNPDGIASALMKIGGLVYGSQLDRANAEEASHLFFASGLRTFLLSTHPPLKERIRRIKPGVEVVFPRVDPTAQIQISPAQSVSFASSTHEPRGIIERIGSPSKKHLALARDFLARLSKTLQGASHEPYGARAVVYSLLLNEESSIREKQFIYLSKFAEEEVYLLSLKLWQEVHLLGKFGRLPLLDLALPTLHQLSPRQYQAFRQNMRELILADRRCNVFEYALELIVEAHLEPRPVRIHHQRLGKLLKSCQTLLSALADRGHRSPGEAQGAFSGALPFLHPKLAGRLPFVEELTLNELDGALREINGATPAIKKRIIRACTACITNDALVSAEEAELMRAIGAALDCPVPPFLPGEKLLREELLQE